MIIHFSSRHRNKSAMRNLVIDNEPIDYSDSVKNLGFSMDQHLLLSKQINLMCRSAFHALYKVSKLAMYLDHVSITRLIHAFVTSRLDLYNSLLSGLPDSYLNKLQRVQNSAARMINKIPKRSHITPTLIQLHWLPITARIQFKLLLITYKCLKSHHPIYLHDLLNQQINNRNLRSSTHNNLEIPRTFIRYGEHAFMKCAPTLWNSLPREIKNSHNLSLFKSRLKTHLFKASYGNS